LRKSRLMSERCIIVTPQDKAIGALDKKKCHLMTNINKGLLHGAFAAFVFHPQTGKLLMQQRASEKITFPDMWTNTCSSHRLDDLEEEKIEEEQLGVRVTATRKVEHELGITPSQAPPDNSRCLTRIHYLAPSDVLPRRHVSIALSDKLTTSLFLAPNEIRDYKWVDKKELQAMFIDRGNSFTPWFKLIARDYLFEWWDVLLSKKNVETGLYDAQYALKGVVDGSKVVSMVWMASFEVC
ncbi:hypothetical protein M407DRAFT_218080, partial [Tulasnella calospora MUT 4182]